MTDNSSRQHPNREPKMSADAKEAIAALSGGGHFMRFLEEHPLSWDRLLKVLPDGIAFVDEYGIIRHANEFFLTLTGFTLDELVGQSVETLVPARFRDAHVVLRRDFDQKSSVRMMGRDLDLTLLRRDGAEIAIDVALAPLRLGARPWVIVLMRDDRARRTAAQSRSEIEQRFRLAFENTMAGMVFTDLQDKVLAVNDAFCQMVGRSREDLLWNDSTLLTHPEDVGITEEAHWRIESGEADQVRYVKRYLHSDGRVIYVEISKSVARDAADQTLYYVIAVRDITGERELTAQLSHQALHDPLTGLANRVLFEDRLSQAHARVARQGGLGAVLLLDLDDFKGVNDTYGHLIGDQVLVAIARRLEQATRSSDTLCRFGGDEFLYLAEGLTSPAEAEEVATRLLNVLVEPFSVAGAHLEQHASLGYVVWDATNANGTEVVRDADAALYEAKREGKGHYVIFTPNMHHQAAHHFAIVQDLRHALQSGQLSMHYQPIVNLTTLHVVGFEALMRWQHPERGWVAPSVFIPLVEQSDLILELGSFALREALAAASSWKQTGAQAVRPFVTVNLSARQFHDPGLVPMIERTLRTSGLAPEQLVIEITESVTLLDIAETLSVIEDLSRLGISTALDDFGTGFSSLSYLSLLHPKIIKIDQSLVSPAKESARNDTLLEAIISLGNKLQMTMLAEGIETQGQLDQLRQLGCELGQGFLFSPAVPAIEVATMGEQMSGN